MKLYPMSIFCIRDDTQRNGLSAMRGRGAAYEASILKALDNVWGKRRCCLLVGVALRGLSVEWYILIHCAMMSVC